MTKWTWIRLTPVVLIALAGLSLSVEYSNVVAGGAVMQDDETLEWLDDYGEALARAKATGKPIFLEFRCSP